MQRTFGCASRIPGAVHPDIDTAAANDDNHQRLPLPPSQRGAAAVGGPPRSIAHLPAAPSSTTSPGPRPEALSRLVTVHGKTTRVPMAARTGRWSRRRPCSPCRPEATARSRCSAWGRPVSTRDWPTTRTGRLGPMGPPTDEIAEHPVPHVHCSTLGHLVGRRLDPSALRGETSRWSELEPTYDDCRVQVLVGDGDPPHPESRPGVPPGPRSPMRGAVTSWCATSPGTTPQGCSTCGQPPDRPTEPSHSTPPHRARARRRS